MRVTNSNQAGIIHFSLQGKEKYILHTLYKYPDRIFPVSWAYALNLSASCRLTSSRGVFQRFPFLVKRCQLNSSNLCLKLWPIMPILHCLFRVWKELVTSPWIANEICLVQIPVLLVVIVFFNEQWTYEYTNPISHSQVLSSLQKYFPPLIFGRIVL